MYLRPGEEEGDPIIRPEIDQFQSLRRSSQRVAFPESNTDDAWELTIRMSPRASVQVLTDAAENLYAATRALTGSAPSRAWAMHLADAQGYFRWICFDLDAGRGNVVKDSQRLTHWLRSVGASYLECLSGPTGGRHVWISVDHLHPQAVHTVAVLAKQLLPTLDTTPLSSRGNGAVRPPLTPHRSHGYSRPLGDVDALVEGEPVDLGRFTQLEQLLCAEGAVLPTPALAGARGIATDAHGRRYLAGDRRDPSLRILSLLDGTSSELAAVTDKSVLQMIVLSGLARARWRFDDVAAHLESSPAFEHSRTIPSGKRRIPRPRRDPRVVLFNDWGRAVDYVAANPLTHVDDTDYASRVAPLVEAVEAVQARADAVPGYWGTGGTSKSARSHAGRPSWRSVLDAVCFYILQSARPDPQINIRRLAAATGYSHEACRLALDALSVGDAPWLERTEPAGGVLAARYRLHPRLLSVRLSTDPQELKLAQGGQTPRLPPATARLQPLLRQLGHRLGTLNRDLFSAPGSLGRAAGRMLQLLSPTEWTSHRQLSTRLRDLSPGIRRATRRLDQAGLTVRSAHGWKARPSAEIDAVDRSSPTFGYLRRRILTYRAEGVRWRWWQAELQWLRLPRKQKRRRPPASVSLLPSPGGTSTYPAYPRSPRGAPDHRGALQLILAGAVVDLRSAA